MAYIFGPCTITHNSVDKGKTISGGNLTIVTTTRIVESIGDPICDPKVKYGTGILKKVEFVAGTISSDLTLVDYASLVLTGKDFTITMPAAKLLWPTEISFGANTLGTFDLGFFFRPSGGNLITFA